ncbi:MAG: hypothetical protein A2W91_08745 [Bacteroidetes bacterium GWF2_38_335]|nr:MAG: hypothetical protein A2W91_08745 [Bacteroidetes bacterium GWF2_38_335]OFY80462.1 MAG: hypothetical protein A2281_08470 [Bacteroidetes bacterium RIFOXYA12_FULL_38_20]HBS85932.1 hypothetical protein [Bacteroidales bacterium]
MIEIPFKDRHPIVIGCEERSNLLIEFTNIIRRLLRRISLLQNEKSWQASRNDVFNKMIKHGFVLVTPYESKIIINKKAETNIIVHAILDCRQNPESITIK